MENNFFNPDNNYKRKLLKYGFLILLDLILLAFFIYISNGFILNLQLIFLEKQH